MKKSMMPLVALLIGLFHLYEAVMAAMTGEYGRMAWKGVLAVVLVVVAWLMNDTGKRFSDS